VYLVQETTEINLADILFWSPKIGKELSQAEMTSAVVEDWSLSACSTDMASLIDTALFVLKILRRRFSIIFFRFVGCILMPGIYSI
jgi:hypothetical protein